MFIEFSIGNFRSFREEQTLSMVATKLRPRKRPDGSPDERYHVIPVAGGLDVLRSAAVYGANASGKSNLVRGLGLMRTMVLGSARSGQSHDELPAEPFLLHEDYADAPSAFEVVCLIGEDRFRYGFEFNSRAVLREWLYTVPEGKRRESRLFEREGDDIRLGPRFRSEGREPAKRTRNNALFLSVCDQLDGPVAGRILGWFKRLRPISGLQDWNLMGFTADQLMERTALAATIKDLIAGFDLGFDDLFVEESDIPEAESSRLRAALGEGRPDPAKWKLFEIKTLHKAFRGAGELLDERVSFDLSRHESDGTERLIALAGPLAHTLTEGLVLVIDEFDARLHPALTRKIIELFHRRHGDDDRAQLIVTTHDTRLLDSKLFRRDQIWLVEKSAQGASSLYSLAAIKGTRNDADLARNYLLGRYGATPFLAGLNGLRVEGGG